MGQMVDDILDGSMCQLCGLYFESPEKNEQGDSVGIYTHEYPVVCKNCWRELSKEDRKMYQLAEVNTF